MKPVCKSISFVLVIMIISFLNLAGQDDSCYQGFIKECEEAINDGEFELAVKNSLNILSVCKNLDDKQKDNVFAILSKAFEQNSNSLIAEKDYAEQQRNLAEQNRIVAEQQRNVAEQQTSKANENKEIAIKEGRRKEIEALKVLATNLAYNSNTEEEIEARITLSYYAKRILESISQDSEYVDLAFSSAIKADTYSFQLSKRISNERIIENNSINIKKDNRKLFVTDNSTHNTDEILFDSYIYGFDYDEKEQNIIILCSDTNLYKYNMLNREKKEIKTLPSQFFDIDYDRISEKIYVSNLHDLILIMDTEGNVIEEIESNSGLKECRSLDSGGFVYSSGEDLIFQYSIDSSNVIQLNEDIIELDVSADSKNIMTLCKDGSIHLFSEKGNKVMIVDKPESEMLKTAYIDNIHHKIGLLDYKGNEITYNLPNKVYAKLKIDKPILNKELIDKYEIDESKLKEEYLLSLQN